METEKQEGTNEQESPDIREKETENEDETEKERIDWHPGFCSALKLELRDYQDALKFEQEHQLNNAPLRVDLIIIRKEKGREINLDFAKSFRDYNLIEYKSPQDAMTFADFVKTLSYAGIYFSQEGQKQKLSVDEITVSMIRTRIPKKLMADLQKIYTMELTAPGVWRVYCPMFVCQLIATEELREGYACLRVLTNRATCGDVKRFWQEIENITDTYQVENIKAVLNVSLPANEEVYTLCKEEEYKNMSQALWDYVSSTDYAKKKLRAIREDGITAGSLETAKRMLKDGVSIQNVSKWVDVPVNQVQQLAASL